MKFLSFALFLVITIHHSSFSQTPNFHWKYQDDGISHFEDRGLCAVFDNNNNLIVAGYLQQGCTSSDISLIKYSPAGDTLWATTYDGSGTYGQDDAPKAITLDAAGNIYVTGYTGDNNFFYAVTLKYDPNGTLLWSQRFLTAESTGNDIKVDASGNVYICGFRKIGGNKDFLLIKYNSSGVQQWGQFFSNGNYDEAFSMCLDLAGDIYVTGIQSGINFFLDWATVKYNSAGNQQWVDVYASTNAVWSEEPAKILTDNAGFIYVAGSATFGNNSNKDFHVIKYTSGGSRVWESSYSRQTTAGSDYPVDMTIDLNGNVYVIGNSVGNPSGQDITTVKFNSTGQFVWEHHIDSILQTDYARSIKYDPVSNSVFIAGDITTPPASAEARDWVVARLDTAGNQLFKSITNGPGLSFDLPYMIALSNSGDIAVTGTFAMNTAGTGNGDQGTILYNAQLNKLWTRYYNGDHFTDDQGTDMVVDAAGNSYVCGFTYSTDIYFEDLVVFKVNASGQKVWSYTYRGTEETSSEKAVAIAVDALQNVYVTGTVDTSAGQNFRNIYTFKLNSSGQLLWENLYSGSQPGADYPVSINLSPNGNVLVAANTLNTTTGIDATVICYNNNGSQLWATSFDNGGQAEIFNAMAIDAQNNIYGAGTFLPSNGFLNDGLLVKFDASGNVLWDTTYDYSSSNSDLDFFNSIALDNAGNVFVAGLANNNFVTAKYLPNGQPEWIQNYSYSNSKDSACVIAVDPFGDVLVAGTFGQPVEADFGIVKYRNDGTLVWDRKQNNSAGSDDIVNDIAVDADGSCYITGWETSNFSTNYNFMTVKYDSAGTFKYELLWTDSLGVAPDYGKRIGLDSNGNIFVMGDANENCFGNTFINGFRWNTQVVRYGQGIFVGDEQTIELREESLMIYPNPASDQINIQLPGTIFRNKNVEISFYDIQGKLLLSATTPPEATITVDISTLPNGLILCVGKNEYGYSIAKLIKQ